MVKTLQYIQSCALLWTWRYYSSVCTFMCIPRHTQTHAHMHVYRIPGGGLRHNKNGCLNFDTYAVSGCVASVLELWKVLSTSSLTLFPCALWPGVVEPVRVSSKDQINLS